LYFLDKSSSGDYYLFATRLDSNRHVIRAFSRDEMTLIATRKKMKKALFALKRQKNQGFVDPKRGFSSRAIIFQRLLFLRIILTPPHRAHPVMTVGTGRHHAFFAPRKQIVPTVSYICRRIDQTAFKQ